MAGNLAANLFRICDRSRIAEANSLRNSSALHASSKILNRSAQGIFSPGQGIFFAPAGKLMGGQGIPAVSAS
jgi:hypothetical protein